MKKFLSIAVLFLAVFFISEASSAEIRLWIDGNYVSTDAEPVIENGRTLVPVRVIAEQMGYDVKWDNETQTVIISANGETSQGKIINLKIGDKTAHLLNPEGEAELEAAPSIINGRTMVPVRFVAEQFGKKVSWDNSTRTVAIGDGYEASSIFQEVKVVRVIDGDTIEAEVQGSVQKIRLIGVNTPETKHPTKGVEFYGKEASEYTTQQLLGKTVYLQKDVSETDKYGRLLRYVWLAQPSSNPTKDEVIAWQFNAHLVKNGYANCSTFPPDVKYQEIYQELERSAKDAKIGLWKGASEEPLEEPSSFKIMGNSNTKKYHILGCKEIEKIKPEHKVNFMSEEEAIAAGYKACKKCPAR